MKYFYSLMFLVILSVTACNKTPTSTNTVESILQTGRWQLSSGTLSMRLPSGKDTSLDYKNTIVPVCHQDDYLQFYSGLNGAVYANTVRCLVSDADSVSFSWVLSNDNKSISIYNSQYFYYAANETIQPFHFDTVSLVLDSLYYPGNPSTIDSIYNLSFTEIPATATAPNYTLVDIPNISIASITTTSFTLNFSVYGLPTYVYPDSTNHNEMTPITRADTFHYSLTYTNF